MNFEDQRAEKRRKLYYYLKVYNIKTKTLIGHVGDLTPKGLMIVSKDRFAENTKLEMHIEFPDPIGEKKGVDISSVAMWSTKDANPDYYITGFKTSDIDEKDLKYLEFVIEKFGFRN